MLILIVPLWLEVRQANVVKINWCGYQGLLSSVQFLCVLWAKSSIRDPVLLC